MKNKKANDTRCGTVGGQAVIEGVMMKSKQRYTTAVRTLDGGIVTSTGTTKSIKDKIKLFKLPVLRGFVNFIETMVLSISTLTYSAEAIGIEEEESKFEKWLEKHFGKSVTTIAVGIGTVLGLLLAFGLFFVLPTTVSKFADEYLIPLGFFKNILEGLIRIAIFVGYVALVALMPDIKRTYEYHGAEHKSIFCHESGLALTVENVKKQKRFHPRCGTSFLFIMLILGIIISSLPFIPWDNILLRILIKICMLPFIVGLGYEIIMFAGKHDNIAVRIFTAPGLWLQRITTREPDDSQIEVAIVALKSALPDIYPPETVFDGIKLPEKAEAEQKDNDA